MKQKMVKVPATWHVRGSSVYVFPADMPDEEAVKKAIEMAYAPEEPLPQVDCEYLEDSFEVDKKGITISDMEMEVMQSGQTESNPFVKNPIVGMTYKVETNRRVKDDEFFGPGESFMIREAGGGEYNFDFVFYEGNRREGNMIEMELTGLDKEAFPFSNIITPEILRNAEFEELSFNLDGCGEDLRVLRVFDMRVEFQDGTVVEIEELPKYSWEKEEAS